MFVRKIVTLFAALASAGTCVLAAPQRVAAPHATVALVSEAKAIVPEQKSSLGLLFQMEPGWHIYWTNPGDSGEPPRVKWTLPPGFSAGDIQWPVPQRINVPSLTDYGYSGTVLLPVSLSSPAQITSPANITAQVHWLVCKEICLPGDATLQLDLPVVPMAGDQSPSADRATEPLFQSAISQLPRRMPAAWQVRAQDAGDHFLLTIDTGTRESSASFLPLASGQIENAAPQVARSIPEGAQLELKKSDELLRTPQSLAGVLMVPGQANENNLQGFLINAPVAAAMPGAASGSTSSNGTASLAAMAGFGLLGGLILNLMPCVFPVLSLKALGLITADRQHGHLRRHGLVYSLGVLVSFWILVAALLMLRAAGKNIGWGFQLQSPAFVVALTVLLFLIGLNLAGLFEFGMLWMGMGSSLAERSGYSGSFFTGVLATVVATPCTAPFMGAAIGFALTQPRLTLFAIFTAMAIGLALPYLLLSWFPQWARLLPQPGPWMETFKQAMAFPLFAAVVWLVWVFSRQAGVDAGARLLAGLLLISIGAWLPGRIRRSAVAFPVALLFLAVALWFPLQGEHQQPAGAESSNGLHWEPFSAQRVQQYHAEGRPVLVDFTAAWCLTCQVNERMVLGSSPVRRQLQQRDVALLRADWTSYDPAITSALASFGRSGVPFYVLYAKGANALPTPLPEVLTQKVMLEALQQL